MIRELLLRAEPGSRVVGEELSPALVSEGLVWVVDPLDGTTNFLHGFPPYAVSIAAAVEGRLEAGVILDVPRNRMYYAGREGGAWRDGDRIHVSSISDPANALVGTGVPFSDLSRLDEYLDQFRRVVQATAGIRRPGSAAIDLATVAEGGFEGFWEQWLSAWEIAAGTLLVREA
ncbi:MAG: inositol monophosphatase family protein, partial [Gemmatimonadales bacterium]